MKKQYVVITESNHHGWIAYFVTLAKAKRLLKIEFEIFYIFKCIHKKNIPFTIKIRYPLCEYYECLSINEYQEYIFEENDDFIIVTENNECESDGLCLKHKTF